MSFNCSNNLCSLTSQQSLKCLGGGHLGPPQALYLCTPFVSEVFKWLRCEQRCKQSMCSYKTSRFQSESQQTMSPFSSGFITSFDCVDESYRAILTIRHHQYSKHKAQNHTPHSRYPPAESNSQLSLQDRDCFLDLHRWSRLEK